MSGCCSSGQPAGRGAGKCETPGMGARMAPRATAGGKAYAPRAWGGSSAGPASSPACGGPQGRGWPSGGLGGMLARAGGGCAPWRYGGSMPGCRRRPAPMPARPPRPRPARQHGPPRPSRPWPLPRPARPPRPLPPSRRWRPRPSSARSAPWRRLSAGPTWRGVPSTTRRWTSDIALDASSSESYTTKPRPRHLPFASSVLTSAFNTLPYGANSSCKPSAVMSSARFRTQSRAPGAARPSAPRPPAWRLRRSSRRAARRSSRGCARCT
mmetsp:Transcript_117402/g.378901  ORF Transcript_117402/g.378901 Transcript_117402/m.378901 type:complete len:268 (-) Transcript_117402:944-1747(-)